MDVIHHAARVEKNLNKENTKPDYNKVYFGPQWRKMGVQEKSPVHKTLTSLPDDIFCIDSDTSDGVKSPLLLRKHTLVDTVPVESEIKFRLSAVVTRDEEITEGPDEGYNSSFGSSLPISTSSPYTSDSEIMSDSDNNEEDDVVRQSDSEQSVCSVVSNGTILHCPSQSSLSSQASLTSLLDRLQCTSSQTSLLTSDQSCSATPSYHDQSSTAAPLCYDKRCTATPCCSTQNTQTECTKLVSRGCQAEDMVVCELNKKLLMLRDRFNKKLVEEETSRDSLHRVKRECSELRMDRFSLLAQADELQKTCVSTMCDRDKYSALVDHKECQLESLRATLKMRDEEIVELRKQLNGASPRHLTDYRELEMLRIDNIRLLHDNRALTSTVDSLNSQLYALRRISKHSEGEETESLVQMNERLAEDNNLLSVNLNALKREHRNVVQEQEDTLEELRYVRSNYKRTLSERDTFHKELLSVKNSGTHSPPTSLLHDNEALISQNDSLKETVSILTEQLSVMRDELETVRSSRDIALLDIDTVLDEKHKLQNELTHMETSNSELWARLAELRQNCSELSESMDQARGSQGIVKSENEELRSTNNLLLDSLDKLRTELLSVSTSNDDLSSKVSHLNSSLNDASLSMSDLRCTMEFLQVEHECIESEMDKKDSRICMLTNMVLQHKQSKDELRELCKKKLKDKTKQLNLSRIKLGYALLEIRELNSQGSTSSFLSSSKSTSSVLSSSSTTKSS